MGVGAVEGARGYDAVARGVAEGVGAGAVADGVGVRVAAGGGVGEPAVLYPVADGGGWWALG